MTATALEPQTTETPAASTLKADIPRATYRFQFNKDFTFKQAQALIPYLAKLGISHCYASPLLTARPGSMHGYDIIDHNHLNPEIGTQDEFLEFAQTLRDHQMGLILDIVPNHMGVGSDNAWWMDVLENGPASPYADYFDIDWSPVKDELQGKVHLPVLGSQYGKVLESGELQLKFNADTGRLSLHYYDKFWPINPGSYPLLLNYRLALLVKQLGQHHPAYQEYLSILTALEHLPSYLVSDPECIEERLRETAIACRRLAALCQSEPLVATFIADNVADYNDVKDKPDNCLRLHKLLEQQAYRLADWHVAWDEINYRRFFDVNDLAGIRTENRQVFEDTHRFIYDLIEEGLVQGLRIDHPDGLYDPAQYFDRLQQEAMARAGRQSEPTEDPRPLYVLVEKILANYERLPEQWPVHGTSGYEFVNQVGGVLIQQENEAAFNELYAEFIGQDPDFGDEIYGCKRLIMKLSLASELNVLAYQLNRISEADWGTRDFTLNSLRSTLRAVVACFPVYRTYVTAEDGVSKKDRDYIDWAVNLAKKRSLVPDLTVFEFVRSVLLLEFGQDRGEAFQAAVLAFAQKFQQFTGPVMAKSLEDTAFYRYNRLIALNEVGGAPENFGSSVAQFHRQNQERAKSWPHIMLASSTHDTKRSEDVRARIAVLSEMPEAWRSAITRWSRINQFKKKEIDGQLAPTRNDELLIYQTLLGVWPTEPLTADTAAALAERVKAYLLKATREAKVNTSWILPNQPYEEAMSQFIDGLLSVAEGNTFLEDFKGFSQTISRCGMLNGLTQTVLKLTSVGVPDIYQGNELWDFSLVDPDNRRPVNYGQRQALAQTLHPMLPLQEAMTEEARLSQLAQLLNQWPDGRIKLYCTLAVLSVRSKWPELFREGDYQPLEVTGPLANHVIAFARQVPVASGSDVPQAMVVVVPRFTSRLLTGDTGLPLGETVWQETTVVLPEGLAGCAWKHGFTGAAVGATSQGLPVSAVLGQCPVAVLLG